MKKNILAIIGVLLVSSSVYAGTLGFKFDNDFLAGKSDKYYTSAESIYYLSPTFAPLDHMALKGANVMYLIGISQKMYTPEDISDPEPILTDRPYAGALTIDLGFEIHSDKSVNFLSLSLGTTGEASLAGQTQTEVHRWLGATTPEGWDNQVGELFIGQFNWQYKYKYTGKISNLLAYDIMPNLGCGVGTIFTFGNLGVMGRIGNKIPNDYATYRMEPTIRGQEGLNLKVYGIFGVEGRYVLENKLLDGYRSHGVEGEDMVGDLYAGIGTSIGRVNINYLITWRSEEFVGQDGSVKFGSIILTYGF